MKRSPLRRRSKATDKWARLYSAELAKRLKEVGECEHCRLQTRGNRIDGHHYSGSRRNENILRFILLCRICHDTVHSMPNVARECGLLARINGDLYPFHPAVATAEERFAELTKALEKGGG